MISDAEKQVSAGFDDEEEEDEEPIRGLFNKYKGAKSSWVLR